MLGKHYLDEFPNLLELLWPNAMLHSLIGPEVKLREALLPEQICGALSKGQGYERIRGAVPQKDWHLLDL